MAEKTIHFQSPRFLNELYSGNPANLEAAERSLEVEIITRDDWITLRGQDNAVALAATFFECLSKGRKQGMLIRNGDFTNLLKEASEGNLDAVIDLVDKPFKLTIRSKTIVPKTMNQKQYLQAIQREEVVFGIGPAGTGKTYLAVASALEALLNDKVERIILTRPAVEAGEALGFLPGDLTEKIQPYLLPLYDAIYDMLGRNDGRRLIGLDADRKEDRSQSKIEIAPLAYMRGRTLSNAFVILDEAQNTTPEQMMMFLTRLGENSRMVITGDKTQVDLPRHKYSGLKEAEKVLKQVPQISFHLFEGKDVVRNPLVQKIIEAYADYEARTGAHRPREVQAD